MPLSSSGEPYGEVIYVVNKRTYGSLYHYAHFICDCLFSEVVQETHQDLAKDKLVLLVKRGCRRDLIADEGLKMRNKNVTCGKERREIANLIEVEENLLKNLGKSYHAVVLEELPFKEQVRLFKEADVIILAHGAAMSNLFFSSLGTLVIEIQCGASYRDFDSICQNLKLKHIKVKKFSVDVTWLLKRVDDHLLH